MLIIVAAGQTVVMVVGEFDLSVGGVAALATAVTASFIATSTLDGQPQTPGSVFWSVALGLAIGVGCGLLNGVLVAYLGVLAFIATLGMAQVFTSLANHRVDGKPVFGLVEHNFVDIARGDLLGVSNKIWIVDGVRRRGVAAARPHHARPQDVRRRRQRPRRLPVGHRCQADPPRRLRRRRVRRRCCRDPPGGDHRDGQHVGTTAVDAAVDRRRCSWAWRCSGPDDRTCPAPCSASSCCARSTTVSTSPTSTTTFRTPSPGRRSFLRCCPRRWHGCERLDDRQFAHRQPQRAGNDETTLQLGSSVDRWRRRSPSPASPAPRSVPARSRHQVRQKRRRRTRRPPARGLSRDIDPRIDAVQCRGERTGGHRRRGRCPRDRRAVAGLRRPAGRQGGDRPVRGRRRGQRPHRHAWSTRTATTRR